jgi:uncharacterized membrane protein YcfT
LWFIYLLAIFFVSAKLLRNVTPLLVFALGALLQMASIDTGWLVIDEFAARFVYFFAGYWLASHVFAYAREVQGLNPVGIVGGLASWAVINAILVNNGAAQLPGIGLVLGFIGAGAVIAMGVLLSRFEFASPIRYCGANSIVIYLSFFMFMAATRTLLLNTGLIEDLGLIALVVTLAGLLGPVLLFWTVRKTPLSILFRRPNWGRIPATPRHRAAKPEPVSSHRQANPAKS